MKTQRNEQSRKTARAVLAAAALGALCLLSGCASLKSFFAVNNDKGASGPIHNPFGEQYASGGNGDRAQNMILRTKKGDRSVEIEIPRDSQSSTDFTIPVAPAFRESGGGSRFPASSQYAGSSGGDPSQSEDGYVKTPPTMADHEITHSFPQGAPADEGERRSIEEGLGVMASDDSVPAGDSSYLGALDHVKSLYRQGRYEAGLLELDGLIRQYPTSPKLHLMRGTLLDRVGQGELALKSWNQALRLDPKNASLRKFIERKDPRRSLASP